MTSDPHELLVAGDDEEAATRATYTSVLEMSLPIVEDLASRLPKSTAGEAATARPDPGPDNPSTPIRSRPRITVATALDEGWLVTASSWRAAPDGNGALAGLTVAVKDTIDVAGLPTHNGTPRATWRDPRTSATVWQRLAHDGAVCVGKAALHEMAWGVTTPAIGNPLDPTRYAGGSSGGSAAAVAGNVCEAALGTDTGGSIRVPAALCGLVGLRPTHGLLPLEGITPLAPSQDVVGPMAKDVTTCTVAFEALSGGPLGASPKPADLRVGVLSDPGTMDEAVAAAYEGSLQVLRRAGVELVECPEVPVREAGALSVVTMLVESAAAHASAVHHDPHGFGGEARALLTLAEDLVDDRMADLLHRARTSLQQETTALYDGSRIDAFLTPTTPCVAPRRDATHVHMAGRAVPVPAALSRHTAWAAAIGWPAITVPVLTPGHMPAGMQLMGRRHHEHVCLSLAGLLEEPHKSE